MCEPEIERLREERDLLARYFGCKESPIAIVFDKDEVVAVTRLDERVTETTIPVDWGQLPPEPDRLDEVLGLLRQVEDNNGPTYLELHPNCSGSVFVDNAAVGFGTKNPLLDVLRDLAVKPRPQTDIETVEEWLGPEHNDADDPVYAAIRRLVKKAAEE